MYNEPQQDDYMQTPEARDAYNQHQLFWLLDDIAAEQGAERVREHLSEWYTSRAMQALNIN
jgi:hypothetical protein